MSMGTERGFAVEAVFCAFCSDTAEGLPGQLRAEGLPEGWVAVSVSVYRRLKLLDPPGKPLSAYHVRTVYYCSEAHLPSGLLPEGAL